MTNRIVLLTFTIIGICFSYQHDSGKEKSTKTQKDSTYEIKLSDGKSFSVHVKTTCLNDGEGIYDIKISNLANSREMMHLIDTMYLTPWIFAKWFVEDMNFDGFLDIRVLSAVADAESGAYDYFIYDPKKRAFNYNEELSALRGKVKFIEKYKTITEEDIVWESGGYKEWKNKYSINNNELRVIETFESKEWDVDSCSYEKILSSKMINGRLVIVQDTTIIEK